MIITTHLFVKMAVFDHGTKVNPVSINNRLKNEGQLLPNSQYLNYCAQNITLSISPNFQLQA